MDGKYEIWLHFFGILTFWDKMYYVKNCQSISSIG